jgi:hypothetical protein
MSTPTAEPQEQELENGWRASTPIDDSVLRRFVFNQADVTRLMASTRAGRYARDDDVSLADSGGPVAYSNQAVLLRPVTRVDDPVLDRIDAFYAECGGRASMMLSVWPLPDLSARGWHGVGHPMFVARGPGPVPDDVAPGVEVRKVTTLDDLRAFERVAVEGYPIPEAQGLPPGNGFPDALLDSPMNLVLGMVDGEPVSAAAALVGSDIVNLCFAATLPAGRRRGVWSALVWARMRPASDLPAVAFTSDFSRPGFVKHGFLPVMRFSLLVRVGNA